MIDGYQGKIDTWDLVNEIIHTKIMTKQDNRIYYDEQPIEEIVNFTDKVFHWAKEANPHAKLLLNDYGMIADTTTRNRYI